MTQYSQKTAFIAMARAAFRSILKSPSSVVFSLAFPMIFILVFGLIGDSGMNAIKIGFTPDTDTTSSIYKSISTTKIFSINTNSNEKELNDALSRGDIAALITISKNNVLVRSTEHKASDIEILNNFLIAKHNTSSNNLKISTQLKDSRPYRRIDFILPGQLGFSLLAASVFGTAFVFYSLRQSLVLKRFFATPIKRYNILLAEAVARMTFQLIGALLIILVGKYVFGFTLIHGFVTVINLLILCAIGLLVFMSFGFAISGIARSESTIPPLANIFTLPQFLLAGTFFSISVFPTWLQWIAKLMPLTHLNEALRKVAFDGSTLWDIRIELLILLLWGIVGYFLASRLFRWE